MDHSFEKPLVPEGALPEQSGTLYVCPTPIGNLSDITKRTLETLKSADVIAAEDTRSSGLLLSQYEIHKPLISYHKFNETERSPQILQRLKMGQNVALITDAGMPAISDPGQILVKRCHEEGIKVSALPGPCAFVTALAMSGLDSRRFVFEGFLPADKKEQEAVLSRLERTTLTTIFYEAPHRLKQTLEKFEKAAPDRQAAAVRELSKVFEECRLGTVKELSEWYREHEPKGEFVVMIEGRSEEEAEREKKERFADMTLTEHMAQFSNLSEKEAMKMVAAQRGLSRREVYEGLLREKGKKES